MALHTLHDMVLEVHGETAARGMGLSHLLRDLSFVITPTPAPGVRPLVLTVRLSQGPLDVPPRGRDLFRGEGLHGMAVGEDAFVSDGVSLLRLQVSHGRGDAYLAPGFRHQPRTLQHRFWAFGLLTLLRRRACYGLHAAGVVTPTGLSLLLVGPSGSGKSSLALGLLRHGWRYLSDDAVLLRTQPQGIEALAFRKPFSIDAAAEADDVGLPLGPEAPCASSGRPKRRVDVRAAYPGQYLPACIPHVLLFPRIVSSPHSVVRPLTRATALGLLLAQSGPELFDRAAMPHHLDVLRRLVRQATPYEVCAGRNLHRNPTPLLALLADAEGTRHGPHRSRAHESM